MKGLSMSSLSVRNRNGLQASAARELANQSTWTFAAASLRSEYMPGLGIS